MAPQKTAWRKKKFLEYYSDLKNSCMIGNACKYAGITRFTYQLWRKKDEEFDKACKDAEERTVDWVESHLYKQIQEGSTAATIFYLCNKGKHRGWQHVQKIEHKSKDVGQAVLVEIVEPKKLSIKSKELPDGE